MNIRNLAYLIMNLCNLIEWGPEVTEAVMSLISPDCTKKM